MFSALPDGCAVEESNADALGFQELQGAMDYYSDVCADYSDDGEEGLPSPHPHPDEGEGVPSPHPHPDEEEEEEEDGEPAFDFHHCLANYDAAMDEPLVGCELLQTGTFLSKLSEFQTCTEWDPVELITLVYERERASEARK